ncbi:MAG: hypothetical protein KAS49_03720 [Candidatus Cloacimonetes bacterium]|nr:hypothetical protein [Candidatus Cloacimonadota bacterium]
MLDILFHDEDYVIVHKPTGILVHRSHKSDDKIFLLQTLRDQIGQKLFPVHRLDRPTSGVIAFALNKEAARELSNQIQQRLIEKKYLAVVRGYTEPAGIIDYALSAEKNKERKEAKTEYKRLATASFDIPCKEFETSRYSLVEFRPKTGRYHQIRKHCAHISHHIIGDTMHGKGEHNQIFRDNFNLNRLMLIAIELKFHHFRLDKHITITTKLDLEFADFLERSEWKWDK